jgi:hypothetical protein
MKLVPLLIASGTVLAACAGPGVPPNTQAVGQSQQAPDAVAQCIAQKWANGSQQQVVSQSVLANNQAVDVYVPGQQPPGGAAAIVRPAWAANSKTWVGFRANGTTGADPATAISACL